MEMFAHNEYFIFLVASMSLAVASCFSAGVVGLTNHPRKLISLIVMALPFLIFFAPNLLQQFFNLTRPVAFVVSAATILGITLFFMAKIADMKGIKVLMWITIAAGGMCLIGYLLIPYVLPK